MSSEEEEEVLGRKDGLQALASAMAVIRSPRRRVRRGMESGMQRQRELRVEVPAQPARYSQTRMIRLAEPNENKPRASGQQRTKDGVKEPLRVDVPEQPRRFQNHQLVQLQGTPEVESDREEGEHNDKEGGEEEEKDTRRPLSVEVPQRKSKYTVEEIQGTPERRRRKKKTKKRVVEAKVDTRLNRNLVLPNIRAGKLASQAELSRNGEQRLQTSDATKGKSTQETSSQGQRGSQRVTQGTKSVVYRVPQRHKPFTRYREFQTLEESTPGTSLQASVRYVDPVMLAKERDRKTRRQFVGGRDWQSPSRKPKDLIKTQLL